MKSLFKSTWTHILAEKHKAIKSFLSHNFFCLYLSSVALGWIKGMCLWPWRLVGRGTEKHHYLLQDRIVKNTSDCCLVALHPCAGLAFHCQQCELVIKWDEKSSMGFIKVEETSEVLTFGKRTSYPLDGQLVLNIPESQNLDKKWSSHMNMSRTIVIF